MIDAALTLLDANSFAIAIAAAWIVAIIALRWGVSRHDTNQDDDEWPW